MTSFRTFLTVLCCSFVALLFGSPANASTIQMPQTSFEVNEDVGAVSVTVTVNRTGSAAEVIQVDYHTINGTAVGPGDYTPASGTLVFDAGISSRTISLPITFADDADDNAPGSTGRENFQVQLTNPRSNAATPPGINGSDTATITIVDIDGDTIGFTATDYQVIEPVNGSTAAAQLTVRRTGNTTQPTTINYATSDITAQAGLDYQPQSGTLTFAAGATTQTIGITVFNDQMVSGNKSFAVTLTPAHGGISTATVTIIDRDTSTARFASANYSVSETAQVVTITVLREGNLSAGATVNVVTVAGTAQPNRNYITTALALTFAPNESARTFDVPIINDNVATGTLFFSASLSTRSNSGIVIGDPATARVEIIDAAPANTVEFVGRDYSVSQPRPGTPGTATVAVRLNRIGDQSQVVTVRYFTQSGTSGSAAVAGQDYTPIENRPENTLTFGPNETLKTFTVTVFNNGLIADARSVGLVLANPTNAFLGTTSTANLTIQNANSAGTIQFSSANYAVFENNGSVTLPVLLNRTGNTASTVRVNYTTISGSATTSRYVPTSGTLTFANGASVATITVPIINDNIVEPPQSFSVQLSDPVNASLGSPSVATVTIQDDDGLNTVQFDAADYGAVEIDGSVSLRVVALRGGDPNQTLTVQLALGATGDTARLDVDYRNPSSSTIVFPPGTSSQRVVIPIINNPAPQSARIFTATLTAPGAFTTVGRQGQARVTILDDSGPNTVQFLTSAQRFREGNQSAIAVTMVRYGDFNRNGTNATFTTEVRPGDTAVPGVNFTPTSGSVEFAPILGTIGTPPRVVVVGNETRKTILIPIPDNNLVQGDVTFHVTLTGSDVAQFGEITTTQITIEDDDVGNVVQLSSSTYSVARTGGNALITVLLTPNGDASRSSSVNFAATGITAFPGYQFSPVNGTLVFAPGETAKTFAVPINPNVVSTGNLTFRVTLSSPSEGTVLGPISTAIVTIVDNSLRSTVGFTPSTYTFAEPSGVCPDSNNARIVELTVSINRMGDPNNRLDVDYRTIAGTAAEGRDYLPASGTLSFGPGETQKTIPVVLRHNCLITGLTSFRVVLSNPGPGLLLTGSDTATVNIADVDSPIASIGFTQASYDVDEGAGFVELTVIRSGGLGVSATLSYATSDASARAGVNYISSSGNVTFAVNQVSAPIRIPILRDGVAAPTLQFTVTLTAADGSGFLGGQSTATVNIIDNDATVFRFNPAGYTVDEGSGTASVTVEALRIGDPNQVISVDYVTSDGTAAAGVKYQRVSGRLTFNAGVTQQTINIPIIDENQKEGTQNFFVNLSNPQGSAGSTQPRLGAASRAAVTILDNDATTFQFTSPTYSVNNSAGNATLTVTLSRLSSPNGVFTVNYATSDNSATAGRDYTPTSGTLTFNAGETSMNITVALTPQPTGTETRNFRVTLSNPSAGAELGNTSTATVVINNFDLSTKLRNVSTRGPVESGQGVMIAGFIVEGDNKQVVLRAMGPSLTQFGVAGAIQDPTLQLMDANGNQVDYNDDYTTLSANDRQTLTETGLTPSDPRESALVVVLNRGPHTAILRGKTDGVGLVEAYDFGATTSSRLVNISTRAKVKENDNGAVIAGFIVSAPNNGPGTAQEVVIRAIGPSLTPYGISGALQDPTLDIYRGSLKVYSNDNWKTQTGTGVGSSASIVATGLQPTNDKEAALRLTLDPGSYSAVVRGKNNTSGISLVEVYQLR